MTRAKIKPPLHKPLFDEDDVIRFAATGDAPPGAAAATAEASGRERQVAKAIDAARSALTLMLAPEVVAHLRAAADRKGKTIEQVVEKLVNKHLGKH